MKLVTKSAESRLLEVTANLRYTDKRCYAIKFNLSNLQEDFKSDYQIKIASNILCDIFKNLDAIIFSLTDSDIVLIYHGENKSLIEKSIFQLRYLFMDDNLAYNADGFENDDFCYVYDLEFNWRQFYDICKLKAGILLDSHSNKKLEASQSNPAHPIQVAGPTLHKINPSLLCKAIEELDDIKTQDIIRSQYVSVIKKENKTKPIFKEYYSCISTLQSKLSFNVDLISSKTLFKYLTEELDKKVINYLADQKFNTKSSYSLNLNIKSLFSEEFLNFDSQTLSKDKSLIIIEIHIADVFEDLKTFLIAKKELQEMGYRICLDGVDSVSITQIDRKQLGFDLVKVKWSEDKFNNFNKFVEKCGSNRVILCHCGNEEAVKFGRKNGVVLFQGRYIDKLSPSA